MSLVDCSLEPDLGIRKVPLVVGHLAKAKHRCGVTLPRRLPVPASGLIYILFDPNTVEVKTSPLQELRLSFPTQPPANSEGMTYVRLPVHAGLRDSPTSGCRDGKDSSSDDGYPSCQNALANCLQVHVSC